VERAQALAFERSCSDETGRLLHALAAQRARQRVGEIGTGVGVGAAWIASALAPGVPFVTVELDSERAATARQLFADDPDVHVLEGDWHELMPPEAPFDLLFYDGGGKQHPEVDGEQVLGLLAPGATLVMDDLTPGHKGPDPVREFWLARSDLVAVELQVSQRECVIVAVRTL
jgi:predicted O-methyltransferase YrrM